MKTGRVAEQRRLVNLCLDRTPGGTLLLNLDKPQLQQTKETFETTSATSKEKALPRLLFCGKFNLSEDQFLEGLNEGQFFLVKDAQGRELYSWHQSEHANTWGTSSKNTMESSKQLTKNEAAVENAALSSWKHGLHSRVNPKALTADATPSRLPAIANVKNSLTNAQWNAAQTQLYEAIAAFDKMLKQAKQQLQVLGWDKEDHIYQNLKTMCKEIQDEKSKLDHCLQWQELQDGSELTLASYDDMMGHAGVAASRLQESLAGVKGQLTARARATKAS
ncbi:unnamed protein product [Durusdinium trenchii]|uniref:Uncharacterized protein n=2 Tax=Durusdinium trenchii TaxID=1381693 RepID=A0ABP0HD79_9DINO